MTNDNGSVISNPSFIDPTFYVKSSQKEFQTLANKHSLIIRAHFKYVSGNKTEPVSWCFDGMDTDAKWNPSDSSASDLYVGRFTPDFSTTYLYFSGNDVKIDLSQTYFEIVSSD